MEMTLTREQVQAYAKWGNSSIPIADLAEALLQAWDVMEHAVKTCPVCDGSTRPHYAHHANCYCEPMRELLGLKCTCIKGEWKSSDCPVHGVECQALGVRE